LVLKNGTKKPSNIETFCQPFIADFSSFSNRGMEINGIDIRFEIGHNTVFDAPTKTFLFNIK